MDDRDERLRAAIGEYHAALEQVCEGLPGVMILNPRAAGPVVAENVLGLIRTLQQLADILDERPPDEAMRRLGEDVPDDDPVSEALGILAFVAFINHMSNARGSARPFRAVLATQFPNELVRALKDARASLEFDA